VDDLVVDGELLALIVDDEDADGAAAVVERVCQALEQVALVQDGEALLDVAGLGHGNNAAILADVEDAVLLEDGAEHVLDDDRGGGVGDEAGLLMELLGEEIHTQVAVLASLGRRGNADDLARAALEDQEIANADVVAGDGDGVGRSHGAGSGVLDPGSGGSGGVGDAGGRGGGASNRSRGRGRRGGGRVPFLDYDVFTVEAVRGAGVGVLGRVVVAVTVDGVEDLLGDLVSDLVDTVAERVVVSVFVVISHITLELLGGVNRRPSSRLDSYGGGRVGVSEALLGVPGGLLDAWLGAEVGVTFLGRVTSYDGTGTFTVLTLGDVNLSGGVLGGGAVDRSEFPVVGLVLDVDVASYVGVVGLLITITRLELDLDALAAVLGLGLLLLVASLLVDVDLLAVLLRAANAVLLEDADFLLDAGLLLGLRGADGGREGFDMLLFVTFPSDVRRSLYFDLLAGFLGGSVTPVRGREDTEGDRNAGFKVQVGWSRGVRS